MKSKGTRHNSRINLKSVLRNRADIKWLDRDKSQRDENKGQLKIRYCEVISVRKSEIVSW